MKEKLLIKIGDFVTNLRFVFLGIFIILFCIGLFNINNVKINDSIVSYLPNNTETKKGLDLMNKEFGSLSTIQFMIKGIDLEEAEDIEGTLEHIKGVDRVTFNQDEFKDNNALYQIHLVNKSKSEVIKCYDTIKDEFKDYDYYIYALEVEDATRGVGVALICCIFIILTILILTSKTYFEPIITFIILGVSVVLNKGSNFIFGEISYITDAIAIILQLALSIDYVIIFMNQYMKEINDTDDLILAIKKTTSKSITEIFASSLTTIAGLMALVFMQLKIGGDIGIVLSKGIICSLLSVILLMPSLLYIFNKVIVKLKKKELNLNLDKLSNFIVKNKRIFLSIFIVLVIFAAFLIKKYNYVYNINTIEAVSKSENIKDYNEIENVFGFKNNLIILVKEEDKDYHKQLELINELNENKYIKSITSLSNYEIKEGLYLGGTIKYDELASLLSLDENVTLNIFNLYLNENKIEANPDEYEITLIDLIYFIKNSDLPLDQDMKFKLSVITNMLDKNKSFVETDNYTRIILDLNLNVEDENIIEALDSIRETSKKYYDDPLLIGNSVNAKDLKASFTKDNIIITCITVLFIFIILMFTFKSPGLTTLLILTIEGSILINFGITTLLGKKIFFMSYIVVSAIQMGATIDYAIIISSRYLTLRKKQDKEKALIGALNDCLPALITSGLILLISGFIVGLISKSSVISSIGLFLGLGTLISLVATIFILPAILYTCDKIIIRKKTK